MSEKKRCSKCHEFKTLDLFTKDKSEKDGYRCECKECKRKRDKEYRHRPDVKTRRDMTSREYGQKNGHKYQGKYKVDASKYTETMKAWHKRNPKALSAHNAVWRAVTKGKLIKASDCSCSQCGKPAIHYHHHNGYEKANWLDVIPLCQSCHRLSHSAYV